jgi:hypothetical protein
MAHPAARARALFAKELQQHGGPIGVATLLLGLSWVVAHLSFAREARTLSALELVSGFAVAPLVAAALWLGHRLVVTEYYGRTQRFVEALPISRGQMALARRRSGWWCWSCGRRWRWRWRPARRPPPSR